MKRIKRMLLTAFVLVTAMCLTGCPKEAGGNGEGGETTYPTEWASLSDNDSVIGTWEVTKDQGTIANCKRKITFTISKNNFDVHCLTYFTDNSISSQERSSIGTDLEIKKLSNSRGVIVFYAEEDDNEDIGFYFTSGHENTYMLAVYELIDNNTLKIYRGDFRSQLISDSYTRTKNAAKINWKDSSPYFLNNWDAYFDETSESNEVIRLTRKTD